MGANKFQLGFICTHRIPKYNVFFYVQSLEYFEENFNALDVVISAGGKKIIVLSEQFSHGQLPDGQIDPGQIPHG